MSPTPPPLTSTVRTFAQQLSATRRGARLARLLAVEQLRTWDVPPHTADRAEQIIAELASNAVRHGHVPGRDFRLGLALDSATRTLRIQVTDARGERLPVLAPHAAGDENGRGLLLVDALATRWGTIPYPPSGKTVWVEVDSERPAAAWPDHCAEAPGN